MVCVSRKVLRMGLLHQQSGNKLKFDNMSSMVYNFIVEHGKALKLEIEVVYRQ